MLLGFVHKESHGLRLEEDEPDERCDEDRNELQAITDPPELIIFRLLDLICFGQHQTKAVSEENTSDDTKVDRHSELRGMFLRYDFTEIKRSCIDDNGAR